MDAQTVLGVMGAMAAVLGMGVAIGRTRTLNGAVRTDLFALDAKYHRLANWKDGLPKELDATYVRQKELALQLAPIHESLQRIETEIKALRAGGGAP